MKRGILKNGRKDCSICPIFYRRIMMFCRWHRWISSVSMRLGDAPEWRLYWMFAIDIMFAILF